MRNIPRIAMLAVLGLAVTVAVGAPEYYLLKAGSWHCSEPEPLENVDEYLGQIEGCEQTAIDWGILAPPEEIAFGVLRIDMGGHYGQRYVRSTDVVLDESPGRVD